MPAATLARVLDASPSAANGAASGAGAEGGASADDSWDEALGRGTLARLQLAALAADGCGCAPPPLASSTAPRRG